MLLTAICEDGFSVASIEKVALSPQALKTDIKAYHALCNSLDTRYPNTLTAGVNYLLVLTTSGVGIEEIMCCASEPTQLMADANTLNALCFDLAHDSYSILKVALSKD